MKPLDTAKKDKLAGYIFYDFETRVNESGIHEVMLACAKRVCRACLDNDNPQQCILCNNLFICETIAEFCRWLFLQKDYIAIAHNGSGFDAQFIKKYTYNNLEAKDMLPSGIEKSTKIKSFSWRDVKIIDSLAFIPTALKAFPKQFGLKEMKKGYFPHLFNIKDNKLLGLSVEEYGYVT